MRKFVAGHVTRMQYSKSWITPFWTQILHLNFKENVEKKGVVTFAAHLSLTIKHLTRYKQKVVLAAMLGGQEYALQHDGQYKSYYFVEILKYHKMSPLKWFLSNFGFKIILTYSVNFCHEQDSNSLFKGSLVMWPVSASGQPSHKSNAPFTPKLDLV